VAFPMGRFCYAVPGWRHETLLGFPLPPTAQAAQDSWYFSGDPPRPLFLDHPKQHFLGDLK